LFRLEICVGKSLFRDCLFPKLENYHLTEHWLQILLELDNRSNPKHINYSKDDHDYYKNILITYLLRVNEAYVCTDFRYAFELLDLTLRYAPEHVQYLLDEKLANCVYSKNSPDLKRNMGPTYNHGPHSLMLKRIVQVNEQLRTNKIPATVTRNFFIKYWTNHILRPFLGPKPTPGNIQEAIKNPSIATLKMTPIRCKARCRQCESVNDFLYSKENRGFWEWQTETPRRTFRIASKRWRLHLMERVRAHPYIEVTNGSSIAGIVELNKVGYDMAEVVKEWKEVARLMWDTAVGMREKLGMEFISVVEAACKEDGEGWTKDHEAEVMAMLGVPLDCDPPPTSEGNIDRSEGSGSEETEDKVDWARRLRDLRYKQNLIASGYWVPDDV